MLEAAFRCGPKHEKIGDSFYSDAVDKIAAYIQNLVKDVKIIY